MRIVRLLGALLLVLGLASPVYSQKIHSEINRILTTSGNTVQNGDSANAISPMVVPYPQPEIYAQWWAEDIKCSGFPLAKKIQQSVQFYFVRGAAFQVDGYDGKDEFIGFAMSWTNSLYVIIGAMYDEGVVRHEMLHHILYQQGIYGHPVEIFATKCHLRPR